MDVDVPVAPSMPACVDAWMQMDVPARLPAYVHSGDGCACLPECLPEMDITA